MSLYFHDKGLIEPLRSQPVLEVTSVESAVGRPGLKPGQAAREHPAGPAHTHGHVSFTANCKFVHHLYVPHTRWSFNAELGDCVRSAESRKPKHQEKASKRGLREKKDAKKQFRLTF